MPENHDVKITQWPKQKALLEHYFKLDKPCPVSIVFDEKPAHVRVGNEKGESFDVDMNMNLKVVEDVPVCIKICEPICAVSDYSIGIELLGQPLAHIRLKGETRLAPCDEKPELRRICIDFTKLDPKQNNQVPLTVNSLQFTPLNDAPSQQFTTMGEPAGQLKLGMPNEGMRIDFPVAVKQVALSIVNFGNPVIQINAFNQSNLVSSQTEMIENTTATVLVTADPVTAIEIKGGSNESALNNVCFSVDASANENTTVRIN
ncbi:MAG: hypothetical protein ACPGQR_00115 [Marinirhabdus sp.]